MKNTITLFALFLFALTGCEKSDVTDTNVTQEPTTFILPAYASKALDDSNNFGIRFFTNIASEERENMMLSPLSANIALNMLMNAADGETYTQIRDMLGYEGLSLTEINDLYSTLTEQLLSADKKVALHLANALFYDNGFPVKNTYKEALKTAYDAEVEGLDFNDSNKTLRRINGWASDNTNKKIDRILEEISPDLVAVLMNAVYFKGDWTQKFEKNRTTNQPFTLNDGSPIDVPTMAGDIPVKVYWGDNFSAYELSYGRNNFVMDLILPNQPLPEFLSGFDGNLYRQITNGMDLQEQQVEYIVKLPKFKFKYEKNLNETLQVLGMTDAFYEDKANLSQFSNLPTYISFVKQNTFVEVNEEGTEAAAVTSIGFVNTSAVPTPPTVHFDRPFIFSIRERTTNTLLFIGTVYNPLDEG